VQFYVHKNNVQAGPFTLMDLRERLKRGEFSYDDLAWRDGLADWTPLREILGGALPDATPHAVAPDTMSAPAAAKVPTGARIATALVIFVVTGVVFFVLAFIGLCLVCGLVMGVQAGMQHAAGATAQVQGDTFVRDNMAYLLGGSGLLAFLASSLLAYFMAFSNLLPWCRKR